MSERRAPLYLSYLRLAIRGQLRSASTLAIALAGQLGSALSVLAAMLILFTRFDRLLSYGRAEVFLLYALVQLDFATAEMVFRGFDNFATIVANGDFDRILARPRPAMFQVLASRFELSRLGRFLVGLCVMAWALTQPGLRFGPGQSLCLIFMGFGGIAIFAGIFILGASLAFYSREGMELINILSDGGREMSQYPLSIYPPWFRNFFTFVIPFGCVNYLPLEFVLGRPGLSPWVCLLPLAALAFPLPCVLAWRRGLRHYLASGG